MGERGREGRKMGGRNGEYKVDKHTKIRYQTFKVSFPYLLKIVCDVSLSLCVLPLSLSHTRTNAHAHTHL